jgi:hypothetical protein
MRHSDPGLTANVYAAPKLLDVTGAFEAPAGLAADADGATANGRGLAGARWDRLSGSLDGVSGLIWPPIRRLPI